MPRVALKRLKRVHQLQIALDFHVPLLLGGRSPAWVIPIILARGGEEDNVNGTPLFLSGAGPPVVRAEAFLVPA
jgi:hypothetical protein